MRRRKRFTIIRIGLALAALAIPAAAQAKPVSTDQAMAQYRLGPGEIPYRVDQQRVEIPYLSHGQGVDASQFGGTLSPDDRSFSRASTPAGPRVEIPYLSQGVGVTPAELGIVSASSPDDRNLARGTVETATVVSDDSWSIDVNPYAVTGFGLALLLVAGGMGLAIRHSRKGTLSPA
ncbi:MAG TPA: hypothetical protein VFM13_01190 [Gaiellaceae bacterium]|nr:hypothetical protein [Gaiellaceae bacterium]